MHRDVSSFVVDIVFQGLGAVPPDWVKSDQYNGTTFLGDEVSYICTVNGDGFSSHTWCTVVRLFFFRKLSVMCGGLLAL